MKRRTVVVLLGGVALGLFRAARAQQPERPRRIGLLMTGAPPVPQVEALRRELRALGWIEDRNAVFEERYAEGRADRAAALAAELARLPVDVIVCQQTPAARAAREATRTIPIVMMGVGAALHAGLVDSLARPGGNMTGVADLAAELGGRRLQLLKDIIPDLARVGALGSRHDLFTRPFLEYMEEAAGGAGLAIIPVLVDGPQEFASAFAAFAQASVQAVIVQGIFNPNRALSLELATRYRLPIVSWDRATTLAGGLFSLSTGRDEVARRAAAFVDRILKGANPADLPVERPTTFDLEVNLRAARALGLTVPQSILIAADEVIE
jgi:putative ABC transport system substrate-binding protein